jgi:hypothetical protein
VNRDTPPLTASFFEGIVIKESTQWRLPKGKLADRDLLPEKKAEIERLIPKQIQHYLTFHNSVFREFVDFGDNRAFLLLMLPLITHEEEPKFKLVAPIFTAERKPDGRIIEEYGITFHQYESADGTLIEDGLPIEEFQFSQGPTTLNLDVSFVASPTTFLREAATDDASTLELAGPAECCNACDWVHSKLGIHKIDKICCAGACRCMHCDSARFFL